MIYPNGRLYYVTAAFFSLEVAGVVQRESLA